jgi:hypothetical protein
MNRVLLACLIAIGFAAPANAWWSKGNLPTCDAPGVISSVVAKFRRAEQRTFHWGVQIAQVRDIYETPELIENTSLIGRRYCRATAIMTDGRAEEVAYLIETKQGFASVTWRVESCLPDYDPWHVYGAWCRSAKP